MDDIQELLVWQRLTNERKPALKDHEDCLCEQRVYVPKFRYQIKNGEILATLLKSMAKAVSVNTRDLANRSSELLSK